MWGFYLNRKSPQVIGVHWVPVNGWQQNTGHSEDTGLKKNQSLIFSVFINWRSCLKDNLLTPGNAGNMVALLLVALDRFFSEIILYSGQVFWYYIFYALHRWVIFNGALDIKQYSSFKRSANEGFISGTMAFPQAPPRWCSYSKTLHSVNLGALCLSSFSIGLNLILMKLSSHRCWRITFDWQSKPGDWFQHGHCGHLKGGETHPGAWTSHSCKVKDKIYEWPISLYSLLPWYVRISFDIANCVWYGNCI